MTSVVGKALTVRASRPADVEAVATIWRAGWHEVHDGHVPDALARARTDESFEARSKALAASTTVVTVDGVVAGFAMVGPFDHFVATSDGPVLVPVRRYVKRLRTRAARQPITTQVEDKP